MGGGARVTDHEAFQPDPRPHRAAVVGALYFILVRIGDVDFGWTAFPKALESGMRSR